MKKKIVILLLLIAQLFTLSACVGNYELSRELLVEAVGVDLADDAVVVTAQVLNTESYPMGDAGSSDGTVTGVYTVEGETVKDAVEKLAVLTGKDPVFSQNRIIILGKSVYETHDPTAYINFLVRAYQSRNNVFVAAAEDRAADIAGAQIGSGKIPAIRAERVIEAGDKCGLSASVRVYEYINMYTNAAAGEYLPLLTVRDGENEGEQIISTAGLIVSQNGRYLTKLTQDETRVFALLTHKIRNGSLTAQADKGPFSLEIISSKPKIKTATEQNDPAVRIAITCSCDISDLADSRGGLTKEDIRKTEQAAQTALQTAADALLRRMLTDCGCDIFGLAGKFLKQNTDFFIANAGRDRERPEIWLQKLQSTRVQFDITVKIRRIGQDVINRVNL